MIGSEAEQTLLGAVIGSQDAYRFAAEVVGPDDFSHPDLGAVFVLVKELIDAGVKVDLVSVGTEVGKRKLRSVTVSDIAQWFHTDGNTGSVKYYARIMRDDALRRSASHMLSQASIDLTDESHSPGNVLTSLSTRLNDLRMGKAEKALDAKRLGEVMNVDDTVNEYDWVIPGVLERRDRVVITAGEGAGKALALDTPIPTPGGWSTMGELKVGQLVFGRDGKPTKITGATDVMRDRECYRVEFSDGSSVVADAEHQWTTEDYKARQVYSRRRNQPVAKRGTDQSWKHATEGVRTTAEIRETLKARGGHCLNHSVTVTAPIQYPERELLVDPYVLGSWLGDGHTADGRMTIGDEDIEFATEEFAKLGYPLRPQSGKYLYGINGLRVKLREIGTLGNKHIPDEYMRASVEQRLALLQGLMDTDGSASNRDGGSSSYEFSVSNERLARNVHELLLGLGHKVTFRESDSKLYGRVVNRRFRMLFQSEMVPFRLPRKVAKVAALSTLRSKRRFVTAVVPVASVPVRCIAVDNDDRMYLCGREFIPTHNTTFIRQMSIAAASGVNPITFLPMEPVRCLVVDAENSERQWRRQASGMVKRGQLAGTANPNENVFLACSTRMDITSDKWLGAIHRVIDDCDPALVSIGPLYRLIQKGMNGEEDMGQILAALDTIRDRGIALIVEAHAGHSKDAAGTRELRPRGSSSLMGWPEFGFGLALEPGNENQVILQRWRGDREERDWPDGFMRGGPWPWTDPLMMQDVRHRAYGNNSLE